MTDPFLARGPLILNVSGGRTSSYMLWRYLDANNGALPPDVFPVFANVGDEQPETLDFVAEMGRRWCPIHWIEYRRDDPAGFAEVDHATAARRCEPLEAITEAKGFLFNPVMRFCTQLGKIKPAVAFMAARGYEHWTSALGLRRDEPRRVARHSATDHGEPRVDSVYPLHAAGVTKPDVEAFWRAQPFDLGLPWWLSNCRGCINKSSAILERTERDVPGSLSWWEGRERQRGARFVRGRTYLRLIERARRPMLPGAFDEPDPEGAALPCACTD